MIEIPPKKFVKIWLMRLFEVWQGPWRETEREREIRNLSRYFLLERIGSKMDGGQKKRVM